MSIRTENIKYVYSEGTPFRTLALDDVNVTIDQGEFVGIIGHTGSGKSTLIQLLNGLELATEGIVEVDGTIVGKDKKKLKLIRQTVGLVFQYPEYQLFEETVAKDVAFGPMNLALSQKEIDFRVKEALELVGFNYKKIKDASPFEISGGQKRRVAIAGVLAMKPDYLILDEPTAGLDPAGRNEIFHQIKKLHESSNFTVVLVSHSMEDIAKLVDRVIVLSKGKIHMQGSPKEIYLQAEELEKISLGIPQIASIVRELRKRGFNIRQDILTIEEAKTEILKEVRRRNV
ncbi:MAG: energy-coupling factor transporter ATPase [Tissierellia bacterium]|jgi:energy-coupling factor transport system ATP-binding protein|nr:energy-coupling factor transporter ATPase [Tissierellia bacterium]MDD3227225.1 energy-coupling factor transporter ATPase [Tissierellia bacterium]MDD3751512.1 energy-coupling factor transporter ATPase [Tissierellia bacterium]MDD4046838.1 energy-coupling factor transporter ATPase [Tissierellia bacterium]MDD4679149.1 energy-coupling factor transporter ATPase [Tissierellia bacterium]